MYYFPGSIDFSASRARSLACFGGLMFYCPFIQTHHRQNSGFDVVRSTTRRRLRMSNVKAVMKSLKPSNRARGVRNLARGTKERGTHTHLQCSRSPLL